MTTLALPVEFLTREAFAPFGEVIEIDGADHYPINNGTTERYHDLAEVDATAESGRPLINIFRGIAWTCPIPINMVERHPLGSQAFIPLAPRPFLVVVADPTDSGEPGGLHAFLSAGGQGVNYRRNVWHHPLLALEETTDFLVVDRGGAGENLEEYTFDPPRHVIERLPDYI